MTVREFVREDKEIFFELCKQFYNAHVTIRAFDKEITEKTFWRVMDHHENLWGYMLIDKDLDKPIGYALITSYWSNEEGGDMIYIDELYLNPLNRHKGYARLFMSWLEEHFTDAAAFTLEVLEGNAHARNFYEKAGFTPDGYISYTKRVVKQEN
jgi:GNAT superfamily N-acetyltransferase